MSSDEEMEEDRRSGSEQEEVDESPQPEAGRKRKNTKKAPQPELPPFEYNDCIEQISKLASDVKDGLRGSKLEWQRIFPTLKKQSEVAGLPEKVIEDLWNIFILYKRSRITSPQRRELIFLLIPDRVVPSSYIESMIQWVIKEANDETNKTLQLPILKYIFGMLEYGLIEGNSLSKPFWYSNLLYLKMNEDLIQWLFLILKKVTKKETIQRFYVTTLLDLWKRSYKPANKKAIVDLLKLYKILRPDLLPDNVFNIRVVNPKRTAIKLPETFTKCLFEAKRRIISGVVENEDERMDEGEDGDDINTLMEPGNQFDSRKLINSNFFPTMAPTCNEDISLKTALTSPSLTKKDKMLWALQDSARLPSLLVDGEMIEILFSWLAMNFNHYFVDYDPKQHHRYEFVLQKCIEVSVLLDESLPPVEDWLGEFLISWDMDLFRSQILVLTSYQTLSEFSDFIGLIRQKFEYDFLYGSLNRSQEIWIMLNKLLLRWVKQVRNFQLNDPASDDNRCAVDSVEKLFEFINGLVTKFIALKFSTKICEPMILRMCQTYLELSEMYKAEPLSFTPIPPVALVDTIILMDSLPILNALLRVMNIIQDWKPTSPESASRLKQINTKLSRYFGIGDLPSLMDLFEQENAVDTSLDGPDQLSSVLKTWNFGSSKILEIVQKNSDKKSKPVLDTNKVRKIAPDLAIYVRNLAKSQKP